LWRRLLILDKKNGTGLISLKLSFTQKYKVRGKLISSDFYQR
jgi:hypothetical protein